MTPLLTRRQAADHDRAAIARGVPGIVLMENAARGAADAITSRWPHAVWARPLVIGGPGLNGGDGWAVARHLKVRGAAPRALLVGERARVLGDARINHDALVAEGITIDPLPDDDAALDQILSESTLIIDALFGTGLDRDLAGPARRAVERANASGKVAVALDLPSGIDADTGRVLGVAIVATLTVTFGAHKRGLHQHPGVDHAGEVVLADIGVAPPLSDTVLLRRADLALPARSVDAHKGSAGRVLVIAGSPGKTGAALLSGLGALRTGAGLVTLAAREPARAMLDAKVVEAMTLALPDDGAGWRAAVLHEASSRDAAVLGPGVGIDPASAAILRDAAVTLPRPTVLDADALTALAGALPSLRSAAAARVLTPHPGEAGALLGLTNAQVQADRYAAASRLAAESGHVAVLKGARTIIAAPDGRLAVCAEGTPALATGGTGDVLTGIIAALLAHLPAYEAACQGVLLHALAGTTAARADRGLLAHEVADAIPLVLAR